MERSDYMNYIQKFVKNAAFLFGSQIISYVIAFFYFILMARYLGAEDYGVLSFALAFTAIFSIFTDLGWNSLSIREIARNNDLFQKYLGNVLTLKIFLTIIIFFVIMLIVNILQYSQEMTITIYLITGSVVLTAFSQFFYSLYQSEEKMEYQSLGIIFYNIFLFVGVIIAIYIRGNISSFALVYLVASLFVLIYNLIICSYKFEPLRLDLDLSFLKSKMKEALPFGLTTAFVTIYYYIDSIMLSFIQGNEVVGIYNVAYRIILIVLFIPSILNIVIFPAMSKFYLSSKESLMLSFRKYFKWMALIGIPMGVGITLFADFIIEILFGTEYKAAAFALQILIWSSVFIFLSGSFSRLLESTDRQLVLTKIAGICALENIILNLILIPFYSYSGASFATVITELTALILVIESTNKIGYNLIKKDYISLLKITIASLIMGIIIFLIIGINIIITVVLGIGIYAILLYLSKVIDEEDMELLNNIRNK